MTPSEPDVLTLLVKLLPPPQQRAFAHLVPGGKEYTHRAEQEIRAYIRQLQATIASWKDLQAHTQAERQLLLEALIRLRQECRLQPPSPEEFQRASRVIRKVTT